MLSTLEVFNGDNSDGIYNTCQYDYDQCPLHFYQIAQILINCLINKFIVYIETIFIISVRGGGVAEPPLIHNTCEVGAAEPPLYCYTRPDFPNSILAEIFPTFLSYFQSRGLPEIRATLRCCGDEWGRAWAPQIAPVSGDEGRKDAFDSHFFFQNGVQNLPPSRQLY